MVSLAKVVDIFTRWIVYIIALIVIYMLILKLTNHSPLLETVVSGGVILLAGIMYKIGNRLSCIETLLETHIETTKNTFSRVWHEIDCIKRDTNETKVKINNIEHRMESIDTRLARIEQKLGV